MLFVWKERGPLTLGTPAEGVTGSPRSPPDQLDGNERVDGRVSSYKGSDYALLAQGSTTTSHVTWLCAWELKPT